MGRSRIKTRGGLGFCMAACLSVFASGGLVFGFPSLLRVLQGSWRDSEICLTGTKSPQCAQYFSAFSAYFVPMCAVAMLVASAVSDFLISVAELSGRIVYGGSTLITIFACTLFCIFSDTYVASLVCFIFFALAGGMSASALEQSATRPFSASSKLTIIHIRGAQLLGCAVYTAFSVFHSVMELPVPALIGSLAIGITFFGGLAIFLWPPSRPVAELPIQEHLTGASDEESQAEIAEDTHDRTSLDQIISNFVPSYGSHPSPPPQRNKRDEADHFPVQGTSLWKKVCSPEFFLFAIYSAILQFWMIFYLATAPVRLEEGGHLGKEGDFTVLLVWLLAASSVLVPLCQLVVDRLGLVGSAFLLHVTFSLWSVCLLMHQYQLVVLSFVLLGATRGVLAGVDAQYWHRIFGFDESSRLMAISNLICAIVSVGLVPLLLSTTRPLSGDPFLIPTIVQGSTAALCLSLPVTLWIRNVDQN